MQQLIVAYAYVEVDQPQNDNELPTVLMPISTTEEERLKLALAILESSQDYQNHYEDPDFNITSSVIQLRDHINGNLWVG